MLQTKRLLNDKQLILLKRHFDHSEDDIAAYLHNPKQSKLSKDKKLIDIIELFKLFETPNTVFKAYQDEYTIGSRKIFIVTDSKTLKFALKEVYRERIIGFDTEQKPSFKKGEEPHPIAIIQFATKNYCFIFPSWQRNNKEPLANIIAEPRIKKVGFGLSNDCQQLKKLLAIKPQSLTDLSTLIRSKFHCTDRIGVKRAVAIFLGQNMKKSKKITLSNWASTFLSQAQLRYATEDAAAPLDIYTHLVNKYAYLTNPLPEADVDKPKNSTNLSTNSQT